MTRHSPPAPSGLNWNTILGVCGVIVCLCAVATFCGEYILPEIKARQKTSDDVDALKIAVASISSDTKTHTAQWEDMHNDILEIKDALKIHDMNGPSSVTGIPVKPLASTNLTPFEKNILNHTTRAENNQRRAALGLPPMPSKAGAIANARELSGNGTPTLADNLTAQ